MARQTLDTTFFEIPITSGTVQNTGLAPIEINNAQTDNTGIVLEANEIYSWDNATIYVRKASDTSVYGEVCYVPFKRTAGGGGGSYTLPVASASTLGGIKVGSKLSIDSNGVLSIPTDYLPLGGGTMTGTNIYRTRQYPYYLRLFGGPEGESSANIQLMGAGFDDTDKNSGRVVLEALSNIDTDVTQLYIKRDGRIYARTPAYSSIDIAGSAIVAKNIGNSLNGYVKAASDEIRQWGISSGLNSGASLRVTFPLSFKSNATFGLSVGPGLGTNSDAYTISGVDKTGFDVTAKVYIPYGITWIAIGF